MNLKKLTFTISLATALFSTAFTQDKPQIIRIPLFSSLDTSYTDYERFQIETHPPKLTGIPENLDTFVILSRYLSYYQEVYDYYKSGKLTEERFQQFNIDQRHLTDAKIKCKLYCLSGLRGDRKIVIPDANNNGDLRDDPVFEFPATASDEEIFSYDNFSPFFTVHFENYYNGQIVKEQRIVKIDPSIKMRNPPSVLEEQLLLSLYGFEQLKGIAKVDGKEYLVKMNRRLMPELMERDYVDFEQLGDEATIYPSFTIGQTLFLHQQKFVLEAFDRERGELLLLKFPATSEATEMGGLVGMKAPNIQMKDLNGKDFDLYQNTEEYVLLSFWGTWCGPCKADHPQLREMHQQYSKKGVRFVGIAVDSNAERVADYVREHKMNWEQLFLGFNTPEETTVTEAYYVSGYPTYFLINAADKIIARDNLDEMQNLLDFSLAK